MFNLDRNSEDPIYIQLADYFRSKIAGGIYAKGFKMPPERDVCEEFSISRGTVKKAYALLINEGFLYAHQGSGTYVSGDDVLLESYSPDVKQKAYQLLAFMKESGYSVKEIDAIFQACLKEKDNSFSAAVVDCNPEVLSIIQRQLESADITFTNFLLSDVKYFKKPDDVFDNFDLIFTTSTHYQALQDILPEASKDGRVKKIALSPDMETIVDLSSLTNIDTGLIGIISISSRFAEIIDHNLNRLDINSSDIDKLSVLFSTDNEFSSFLQSKTHIITPPLFALNLGNNMARSLLDFYRCGGKLIIFNYKLEKGSLLRLEEYTDKGV